MPHPISDYSDTRYPFRFIVGEVDQAARTILGEFGEVGGEAGFYTIALCRQQVPDLVRLLVQANLAVYRIEELPT